MVAASQFFSVLAATQPPRGRLFFSFARILPRRPQRSLRPLRLFARHRRSTWCGLSCKRCSFFQRTRNPACICTSAFTALEPQMLSSWLRVLSGFVLGRLLLIPLPIKRVNRSCLPLSSRRTTPTAAPSSRRNSGRRSRLCRPGPSRRPRSGSRPPRCRCPRRRRRRRARQ